MNLPSTFARRSAAAGVVVWLLLLLGATADSAANELVHKIVLFAVFVIVPLGLSLVGPGDQGAGFWFYRAAVLAQPVAALATAASFFFEKGLFSASLSFTWFVVTLLVALFGLTRFISRGLHPLEELSIDAGLLYLPVAGIWLLVYRLGVQPLGYGEMIILLTVIHFHFAGFAAPIVAGMSGRILAAGGNYPKNMFGGAIFGIVAAMPLVAAGITFSAWLGLIGTLLLSTGLVMLAVLTLGWVTPALRGTSMRFLLVIGAPSSCLAMVLACLYAYSIASKTLILAIPTMAMTHGLLNAFGFVTCSLVAWSRIKPPGSRKVAND